MKNIFILFAAAFSIAACTNTANKSSEKSPVPGTNETVENVSQTICFQKLEGKSNQDTSYIRLNIDGEKVSGEFSNMPFEKDSRKGTLHGTKNEDLIKGIWIYTQEGINDTMDLEFKLSDNKLIQKNYTIDPKTGKEVFSDGSMFTIEYKKVECSQ